MIGHPRDDLAAYALGALDPDDGRRVMLHVETCASCSAEVASYSDVVWQLAEGGAPEGVPAGVRERVLRRPPPSLHGDVTWDVVSRRGVLGWLTRPVPLFAPLALVLLLVVSAVTLATARRETDAYAAALNAVASGRVVALEPVGASAGRAAVVVDRAGAAYLVVDLPEPPSGSLWAAWVIKGDRPSLAAEAGGRGVVTLRLGAAMAPGDTVAITLERPGAAGPTTPPVLVGRM